MKKVIAGVMSLVLCLSAGSFSAVSAVETDFPADFTDELKGDGSGYCGKEADWSLSGGVMHITGSGKMADWQSVNYVPWNKQMSEIRQVIIDEGITSVGMAAFANAKNLTSVKIPSTVTEIGSGAFKGTGISSIELPSVETIGMEAFNNCANLREVKIYRSSCSIVGGGKTISNGTGAGFGGTIYAPSGSVAKSYASSNNYNFSEIGSAPVTQPTTQPTTTTTTTQTAPPQTTTTTNVINEHYTIISSVSTPKKFKPSDLKAVVNTFCFSCNQDVIKSIDFDVELDGFDFQYSKSMVRMKTTSGYNFKPTVTFDIPSNAANGTYNLTIVVKKVTDVNGKDITDKVTRSQQTSFIIEGGTDDSQTTASTTTTTSATTTTTTSAATTTTTTSATTTVTTTTSMITNNPEVTTTRFKDLYVVETEYTIDNFVAPYRGIFGKNEKLDLTGGKFDAVVDITYSDGVKKSNRFRGLPLENGKFTTEDYIAGGLILKGREYEYTVDTSAVDMTRRGTYPITISIILNGTVMEKKNFTITVADRPADKMGDANLDGVVDARDATAILTEYAVSSTTGKPAFGESPRIAAVSDVNGDNIIDGRDATEVCTYYAYISIDGNPQVDFTLWYQSK